MNTLVIVPLILCAAVHVNAADKQEAKTKTPSSPVNTIQQNQKYEMIYQPVKFQQPLQPLQPLKFQQPLQQQIQYQPVHQLQPVQQFHHLQQRPQYIPIQIIPRQYYVQQPQPQPQAMIIIAQPALLPQSLVYGNPTQQLLNYFHSNPQAKYQLLHGNYQPTHQPQQSQTQTVQPTATYMHPVIAAPTLSNYILTAPQVTTQPQLVTQTSPMQALQYTTQQAQQVQQVQPTHQQQQHSSPQQLTNLAQLAQLAAQQYLSSQMKTAPAIVTGFEHFSPEQQAQIKQQLSTHLGTDFHAVSNGAATQYSSKYVAGQENASMNNNFVPSPQIKSEPVTTISSQSADILKTRYMKGKN